MVGARTSREEKREIIRLRVEGHSLREIARRTGRELVPKFQTGE